MKPDNWTLVRGARQLLTLHHLHGPRRGGELASLGVIPDGSVLIRNGVIEAVGPTRRIENMADARDADEINASGRVVMPAFVDCHACLVPVPAYQGDAARTVKVLPATRLEAQAGDLLKIMSSHGTATVGALSGYGVDSTGELKILRALRALDKKPLDLVSILFMMEDTGEGPELLSCVARRKLAAVAQVRCGNGGMPLPAAQAFLETARSLGLGRRLEMLPGHDARLVSTAVNMQALSISTTRPFTRPEIELLSYSSTFAILLPAISEDGAYARQLIDDGGLVAMGSGISPETGATASMQTVVQMACERLGLTVAEAISATTVNAAWALGVGTHTGSLEHGKLADLILLNSSDYREIPLLAGTNLTHSTIKRGVVVFREDFPGWPQKD
jgi:imidazolonepropionase